ncbi:hypothetical protein E3E36_00490 [Thermococcus sp. M36]|nr:hypothetical protein [Thermococcus sp. M36]
MRVEDADPLHLVLNATRVISPTLIQYELGSDIEVIMMNFLHSMREAYDDIMVVSFYDGYHTMRKYAEAIFGADFVDDIFNGSTLVSVNSFLEDQYGPTKRILTTDPEIIVGRLLEITGSLQRKTLVLLLGLDFYGIRAAPTT